MIGISCSPPLTRRRSMNRTSSIGDLLSTSVTIPLTEVIPESTNVSIKVVEDGNKYYDAFNDKDIQQLAWSKYGFRTGVTGGSYDVSSVGVSGIPQTIDTTVSGLRMSIYTRLIEYLGE